MIQRARQLDGLVQLRLSVVKDNDVANAHYEAKGFQVYGIEPNAMKTTDRPHLGVDHVAQYTPQDELHAAVDALKSENVPIIRAPVERGEGWTVNFLDPDGTQFEFHSGTLAERMKIQSWLLGER